MAPFLTVYGTRHACRYGRHAFFSEALKEGGKTLGKEVSERTAQLVLLYAARFKSSGTEGLLVWAEKQPSESNIALVEAELVA